MHVRPQSRSVAGQHGSLGPLGRSLPFTQQLGLLPPVPGKESNTEHLSAGTLRAQTRAEFRKGSSLPWVSAYCVPEEGVHRFTPLVLTSTPGRFYC